MPIANESKQVYQTLKDSLEADHLGEFVAIEPSSKSHFIGKTFIDAAMAAKKAFPDQISFVIRIGQEAAFHIGASAQ